jgi:nucleotide-binding universal stress UspA family protein
LLNAIEDPANALVVLTTHGHTLGPGDGLGPTAEAVIAGAERPVLFVRPEATPPHRPPRPIRRLLVPVDGTPGTTTALRPVVELANDLKAKLYLLYVLDTRQPVEAERGTMRTPRYLDQPHHEWAHWTDEAMRRLLASCPACPPDVPVEVAFAKGDVEAEVHRLATEQTHDTIVLVRRSHLESGRAPRLRAILACTPCPVLIVGGPPVGP